MPAMVGLATNVYLTQIAYASGQSGSSVASARLPQHGCRGTQKPLPMGGRAHRVELSFDLSEGQGSFRRMKWQCR